MRLPRILARYAAREALIYAALGLLGVGGILVTQNLLRQLSDVAGVGLTFSDVLTLVGCVAGLLAAYAVPVAFLFGVVAAVSRLSADAEILAMRSLGVGVAQLAVPFVLLALLTSGATALLLNEVEPGSRRRLRAIAADIAARGGMIEPGRFRRLDRQGERLLFVERYREQTMAGVFLTDRSDPARPYTVVAETGRFAFDREQAQASMVLENGDIHFQETNGDPDVERHISFGRFTYTWDVSDLLGAGLDRVNPRELRSGELREALDHFDEHGKAPGWARRKERWRYDLQVHRRWALAAAPLLFAPLGVSLGLRRSRGAGSWGALVCTVLVFGYYVLLSFGTELARGGGFKLVAGLWLPNAVFAAAALAFLVRARRAET